MRRHVYFYDHVRVDMAAAVALLSADPGSWLPPPARPRDGTWVVELRADGALPEPVAGVAADVDVGPPEHAPDRLLRVVRWRCRVPSPFFPVLEADLELERLAGGGCRLALLGSYRPPLPAAPGGSRPPLPASGRSPPPPPATGGSRPPPPPGSVGDQLAGHRIAEACVRRFVLDIAARLSGEGAASEPQPPARRPNRGR